MKGVLLHIFILLFLVVPTLGQEQVKGEVYYELGYHRGQLMKIFKDFPESDLSTAYDFTIGWNTKGAKYWQQLYNYPTFQLTLSFSDFSNKDVLGYGFSILPGLSARKEIIDRLHLQYRGAAGVGLFNNPYHPLNNPTNNVIGAKATAAVDVGASLEYEITPQLEAFIGGSVRHYSNGHSRVPNVGANLYYLNLGVSYVPNRIDEKHVFEQKEINKKWLHNVAFGFGKHEIEGTVIPTDGPSYPVYFGGYSIAYRYSERSQVELGVVYNYYADYYDFIINQQLFTEQEHLNASKVVAFVGHEFFFDRVSFEINVGANVFFPYRHKMIEKGYVGGEFMDLWLSGKAGFNYYLYNPTDDKKVIPYIGTAIRSIGGKADFLEISSGIVF